MQANRTATVLFAEPNSGTKRSEASRKALAELVVGIAESTGGRVVKTIGGKLMVVFASPDAAASACDADAVRFHTLSSWPAASSRADISRPIWPKPRNPIFIGLRNRSRCSRRILE